MKKNDDFSREEGLIREKMENIFQQMEEKGEIPELSIPERYVF